jgi:hypothetical protein
MKRALTWGVALAVLFCATSALAGGGGGGGPAPGGGGGAPEPETWALMLFSLAPGAWFARRALRA